MTSHIYAASEMTASLQPPDHAGSAGPVGLLTLRAWLEEGAQPPLRVRVTRLDEVTSGEPTSFVTASVEDIESTLRDWLQRFLAY